jgi:hypothetical protein
LVSVARKRKPAGPPIDTWRDNGTSSAARGCFPEGTVDDTLVVLGRLATSDGGDHVKCGMPGSRSPLNGDRARASLGVIMRTQWRHHVSTLQATVGAAIDLGIVFVDSADVYGNMLVLARPGRVSLPFPDLSDPR